MCFFFLSPWWWKGGSKCGWARKWVRISMLRWVWGAWNLQKTQRGESAFWSKTRLWRVLKGSKRGVSHRGGGLLWGFEASGAWKQRRTCSRSGRRPPLELLRNPATSECAAAAPKRSELRREQSLTLTVMGVYFLCSG